MAKRPRTLKDLRDLDQSLTGDQTTESPTNPVPEMVDFALSDQDQVDLDAINEILSANDLDGGKIRLDRKGPNDQNYQYLISIPIKQFDIEWIKRVHGGGDYKGKTFRSNGQVGKQISFSIDYRYKGANDETAPAPRAVSFQDPMKHVKELAEMVTSASKGQDSSQLVREMMAQSRSDSQNMIAMMAKSAETQMATITAAFASLAQVQASSAASAASKPSSLPPEVWAAIIAATAPIVLKLIDKGTPVNNTLETIELIKSIKDTFGDSSDKEESMLGSFFKAVGPAFSAMTGMNGNAPRQLPAPVGRQSPSNDGAGAAAGNLRSASPSSSPSPDQILINNYLMMLYDAAENDMDPVTYSEMLFNHAPPAFLNRLCVTLQKPDWTKQLFNDDPRVLSNAEWFGQLRECILNQSTEQNDIATDTPDSTAEAPSAGSGHDAADSAADTGATTKAD